MITALTAAILLASPQLEAVRECEPGPLGWRTTLYRDGAEGLFIQEAFAPETGWAAREHTTDGQIAACFGASAPHSRDVLLHRYLDEEAPASRRGPVLIITGAGYSALDTTSFLAASLAGEGHPTYALTFAHRHGDNLLQAEQIANAVGLIRARHTEGALTLIGYSKGGVSARIYCSNSEGVVWGEGQASYASEGTRYRGDVDLLVLLGAPNAGVDTPFRWSASNLGAATLSPPPDAPTAWTAWYPQTTSVPLIYVDLEDRHISGPRFRGQAQLLADLSGLHATPGGNALLGVYANQVDYYTTWHGGYGFVSHSRGIEEAIEAGGGLIAQLDAIGVDPRVSLLLAAGGNPIIGVGGTSPYAFEIFWGDEDAASRRLLFEGLAETWLWGLFPWGLEAFSYDLPRLFSGSAYLGEISGPSDGLVFIDSALATAGLTARGAPLRQAKLFEALGHAELTSAGALAARFFGDEALAGGLYEPNLSEKYSVEANQLIEWLIAALDEGGAPPGEDAGLPASDGGVIPSDAGQIQEDAGQIQEDVGAIGDDLGAVEAGAALDQGRGDAAWGADTAQADAWRGGDAGRGADAEALSGGGGRSGEGCAAAALGAPTSSPIIWAITLLLFAAIKRSTD
ncbi:hypothetical protein KKB55_07195 [Myxococcota bacterium]|nr:hypothetical protein [Myxococcota bacterium]MBU1897542.1 hypothetical protein [Myxococcota bacterium]